MFSLGDGIVKGDRLDVELLKNVSNGRMVIDAQNETDFYSCKDRGRLPIVFYFKVMV